MATVVIGGHSRNIGKTSATAALISAMPELRWTAFKITQYGHGVCSAHGQPCDCATDDHSLAVSEERSTSPAGTDSARYLAAGAERSLWVRTRQGQLAEAMPRIRRELAAVAAAGGNAIFESNSIMGFLRPALYLPVLDAATADFKASALRYLDRADALLIVGRRLEPQWKGVSPRLLAAKPSFAVEPPSYVSPAVFEFVRARLLAAPVVHA